MNGLPARQLGSPCLPLISLCSSVSTYFASMRQYLGRCKEIIQSGPCFRLFHYPRASLAMSFFASPDPSQSLHKTLYNHGRPSSPSSPQNVNESSQIVVTPRHDVGAHKVVFSKVIYRDVNSPHFDSANDNTIPKVSKAHFYSSMYGGSGGVRSSCSL
jgi:hypothetical protein